MLSGGGDSNLCTPARIAVTAGSDQDLTAPFNVAAFGNQLYARVLQNGASVPITVVAVGRLDASVVGGGSSGMTFVMQPGQSIFGQWITVKTSGSSFTTGQLIACA